MVNSTFFTNVKALVLSTEQNEVKAPEKEPEPIAFTSKLIHIFDRPYHEKRVQTLAKHYVNQLEAYLEKYPNRPVKEALKDEFVYKKVRNFLRSDGLEFKEDPFVKQCKRLHLCAKLGITPAVLDANPGFEEYASKSLERYLLIYEDKIIIDESTLKIQLKFNGVYTPWSEILSQKVERDKPQPGELRYHWNYDKNGVQWNKDFFVFETLEPMFERNGEEWDNKDVIEICACDSAMNLMSPITGVHVWFRIKTKEGHIYPLGVYRPAKLGFFDHFNFPFRIKPVFYGYEISEFWPLEEGGFESIEIEISEDHRKEMLAQFLLDAKDKSKVFQISQINCVKYASDLLSTIAKIVLPTEESIFGLLNPERFKWITDKIPAPIRKVCVTAAAPFVNLLQLGLGVHLVDKRVSNKNVKPIIHSPLHLFSFEKSLGHHPFTFMKKTSKWVKEWRNQEAEKLKLQFVGDELNEKLRDLKYQIPPESELHTFF